MTRTKPARAIRTSTESLMTPVPSGGDTENNVPASPSPSPSPIFDEDYRHDRERDRTPERPTRPADSDSEDCGGSGDYHRPLGAYREPKAHHHYLTKPRRLFIVA